MRNKWLVIAGIAGAAALSAQATLVLDWNGMGNVNSFGGSTNVGSVVLTGITANSATKSTDIYANTAVTVADFGGTGSLGVTFTAGDAFNTNTWAFNTLAGDSPSNTSGTTILSSRSGGYGLGVHTDVDGGTVGRMRTINSSELLQFAIDTSSLTLGSGQSLQVRVKVGTGGNAGYTIGLYEKTGANSGAFISVQGTGNETSGWLDVAGLKTFALSKTSQTDINGVALNQLEFQVIPEPATLGMVAACGAGILIIRRRFMI